MIHASRRKILALFTAAPAALPVAIKEAAEKAGIASITDLPPAIDHGMEETVGPSVDWDSHLAWLRDRLGALNSPQCVHERRRRAEEQAHRLNPNLAALRSLSPAVAYRIEVERQVQRLKEHDRVNTQFNIVDAMRRKAMGR